MMNQTAFKERKVFTKFLFKRMLLIGSIGLAIVSVFVIGAGKGDQAWGSNWQIKPLLLTPILGAIIGLLYDITEPLRKLKGIIGITFTILSVIAVLIGLFISLVLGLNGTMWD